MDIKRFKVIGIIILVIIALIILADFAVNLDFNIKKHIALGFPSVYELNLKAYLIPMLISAILFCVLSVLLVRFYLHKNNIYMYPAILVLSGVIGLVFGMGIGNINPIQWLLFFHHASFSQTDPIFHFNYAFYVYELPIFILIVNKCMAIIFYLSIIGVASLALLLLTKRFRLESLEKRFRHILSFFSLIFLFGAISHLMGQYTSLFNKESGNFLYGPGYTAVHFTIPSIWVTSALILLIGVSLFMFSLKKKTPEQWNLIKNYKWIGASLAASIAVFIIISIVAAAINRFHVHPNEASVQKTYIKHTIQATRWAFGINDVKTKKINPKMNLTNQAIKQNQLILANVRINDIGQTKDIYNQLQSFKSYFQFISPDVDRYNGHEVYVDARQLDQSQLPVKTWINEKFVYTHGYGLAASPVNKFDNNGLPITVAKDTPQITNRPMPKIKQPNIYFGTMNGNVIAPSKQKEFDYPVGDADHSSHYKGGHGIPIKGNRLLLALKEGTLKYFTSQQITAKSELLFDRDIHTRARDIAPFLSYGKDIFPFVNDKGQIEWMMDAYTQTNHIPYAQRLNGVNYIRNPVKVVMNAYTGKMTYYVINQKDPMIQTLMNVYPRLFTTKVPNDIKKHFRYPKKLFQMQTKIITTYHMTNPVAFYNREDLWNQSQEIYQQNQKVVRPPIYQMLEMPGQTKPHFVLSQLFTPNQKMNLNGWLIAGNDPGEYGKLTLYQFPQKKLVFGPLQTENEIDSNPNISSQLTLWNQNGSKVIRGNLLLIPIANTTIYIEPVYLVSNRSGSLPQLQRVIVDFNKKVYMGDNLADALKKMINGMTGNAPGNSKPPANQKNNTGKSTTPSKGNKTLQQLAKQANNLLDDYKKQTSSGNFTKAGQDLNQVQSILKQMAQMKQNSK